jgi:NAD(P)-dependent dehydrogenase (short-subunit alcohol dehydrogenase family)
MGGGRLEGKVVVVVGGTSGLGLAGVRACLAAGAHVVAVGLPGVDAKALEADLGPDARVMLADARLPETVPAAIRDAVSAFGGFDALYHVAGGSGRVYGDGPLHEVSEAGWDETLRQNLTTVGHSNRAAARELMSRGRGGSVLNMGSVTATSPSPRYFATHAYAAAKAGIVGLSVSAASYYAPHGIRFNVVTPGLTETPMSRRALGDAAIMDFIRNKQPLGGGRVGQPTDLDAAVVFFLSDDSRFVTGQVLAVDGGWSVSEGVPRA